MSKRMAICVSYDEPGTYSMQEQRNKFLVRVNYIRLIKLWQEQRTRFYTTKAHILSSFILLWEDQRNMDQGFVVRHHFMAGRHYL